MVIRFVCPNGHKVHCPDEQAGRAARCPHCGVRFRVPGASQPEDFKAEKLDSGPVSLAANGSGPGTPGPVPRSGAPKPKEAQIEFLCPNGHRLHGPASLQGRPGQCPECNSKFRIPSYENEVSDEEELEQDISSGRADGSESGIGQGESELSVQSIDEEGEPADEGEGEGGGYQLDLSLDSGNEATEDVPLDADVVQAALSQSQLAGQPHPWGRLFARLWSQKTAGVVVELCLKDGETIVPDRFARGLSRQGYGVFAVKNANGTYTITSLPWTSVSRVLFRGLKQLPADLFG